MRFLLFALVAAAFLIGGEVDAYMAASLMPVRDGSGSCMAADQDIGDRLVGPWPVRAGRCELRDWRVWHPFSG